MKVFIAHAFRIRYARQIEDPAIRTIYVKADNEKAARERLLKKLPGVAILSVTRETKN